MKYLPDPIVSILKYSFYVTLFAVVSSSTLLYTYQTKLIYPANMPEGSRKNVSKPSDFGIKKFEDIELISPDGVKIRAFVMLVSDEDKIELRPTVLLLHANAGNVGHRLPIAKVFLTKMKCNVVALSYRGYGRSEGTPTEVGLKLDAQTALDYILSHPKLEKTHIFLYGQSIGGAVAIHLGSNNINNIKGIVVENTFLSLTKLVPHVLPFLKPFLFLLHQIWNSELDLMKFRKDLPVLFLSGSKDELIPPYQIKTLYEQCPSTKKEFQSFELGTHNDTYIQPHYFPTIATFISKHTKSTPSAFSSSPILPPSPLMVPSHLDESENESVGSFDMIGEDEVEKEEVENEKLTAVEGGKEKL